MLKSIFSYLSIYLTSLKYKIRYKIPLVIYDPLSKIGNKQREYRYREQKKNFGKLNPSLFFYVIRKRPPGWGFFSNLFYVLQGLKYSEELQYIPVVDMENYFMSELSATKPINGTRNAWSYFFDQVSDINLKEVYKSKNVLLSDGNRISQSTSWLNNRNTELIKNSEKMLITSQLINRYINLNESTIRYIENLKHQISWSSNDTVGIFVRGSAYYNNIQFPANTLIEYNLLIREIKIFLEQNTFKYVYICTEDYRFFLDFIEIFKKYNILPNVRFDSNTSENDWIKNQKVTNIGGISNMGYYGTRTYLSEIWLLSECNNFIGTFSNASVFAIAKSLKNRGKKGLILPDRTYYF